MKSAYAALNRRHGELAIEHQTLSASVASVEDLEKQAEQLREQIKELKALREPLILGPGGRYRGGLRCTGSMEPVITCLDEATWVADFQPEAIVVGTTISFAPDGWGGDGAAHRVTDVKVEGGVYFYWPKGDNNSAADGCWVPHTDVLAYITEIHRGVRPENAELRQHVNGAKAAVDEAWAAAEAAWATLEERDAGYQALIDRYCGVGVNPSDCALPEPQYSETIAAWRDLEFARWEYSVAVEEYEGAAAYFACWVDTAGSAEWAPGEPPIFALCPIPPPVIIPPPQI